MSNQADTRNTFAQVKETTESVIIALILAFVFRAFVVEAFVIPTGSMAPTLYGQHIDHVCTNCGYHFAIGSSPGAVPVEVRCPNCDWIDQVASGPRPDLDNGDRILVLKWPYALDGFLPPRRWDVVVFKAPFASGPTTYAERDGQTNYIKRLIGLPGDILEVIDGDIYTCRSEEVSQSIGAKLAHVPLPEPLTAEERKELNNKLRIAPKTPDAQEALWQIVYDADYQPTRKLTVAWQAMTSHSSWKIDGRLIRFDGPQVEPPQFIELTGKDFRDDYGYNEGGGKRIVSDLEMKATMTWQAGDGTLLLCLSKYNDLYTVEFSPRKGLGRTFQTNLLSQGPSRQTGPFVELPPPGSGTGRCGSAFTHVDHQLQLRFDEAVVWQSEPNDFPTSAAWALAQGYESSPPLVRVGGRRDPSRHPSPGHLPAMSTTGMTRGSARRISSGRTVANKYTDRPAWASRDNPMLLRHNEYFVHGRQQPAEL